MRLIPPLEPQKSYPTRAHIGFHSLWFGRTEQKSPVWSEKILTEKDLTGRFPKRKRARQLIKLKGKPAPLPSEEAARKEDGDEFHHRITAYDRFSRARSHRRVGLGHRRPSPEIGTFEEGGH
jgi:hypothetical protein